MIVMNSGSQLSEMTTISHFNFICICSCVLWMSLSLLVMSCLLITLIKCLKGHKSQGAAFEGVPKMSLSLSLSFLSDHVFSSLWSNVSSKDCPLKVFSKCICVCLCNCVCQFLVMSHFGPLWSTFECALSYFYSTVIEIFIGSCFTAIRLKNQIDMYTWLKL